MQVPKRCGFNFRFRSINRLNNPINCSDEVEERNATQWRENRPHAEAALAISQVVICHFYTNQTHISHLRQMFDQWECWCPTAAWNTAGFLDQIDPQPAEDAMQLQWNKPGAWWVQLQPNRTRWNTAHRSGLAPFLSSFSIIYVYKNTAGSVNRFQSCLVDNYRAQQLGVLL